MRCTMAAATFVIAVAYALVKRLVSTLMLTLVNDNDVDKGGIM